MYLSLADRRLCPANGRVALAALKGQVEAASFTEGRRARVTRPLAELRDAPHGARDRQLLLGAAVLVLEEPGPQSDGTAFVRHLADGYVGYMDPADLGPEFEPTHWVAAPASHIYSAPDIKSPERAELSLGAALAVTGREGRFATTPDGHVPAVHLLALDDRPADPLAVAETLLGVPYLWGGNSHRGLDCAALVQIALMACGIACPADSDQQEEHVGRRLEAGTPPRRGDLVFWRGHVAFMADRGRILHANAHAMAVSHEDFDAAVARIIAAGEGPVTQIRRL